MKLTYDPDRNVAYLRIREPAGQVDAVRLSEDVLIDMGPDGTICGIELLNANEQLRGSDGGQFVFVDPRTGEERQLTLA
jgi:uncharacterized protein YuzE